MPGPFPGMDPYLEHPGRWRGVQLGIIHNLMEVLNPLLVPNYVADIGERVYVVPADRGIYPDVTVIHRPMEKLPYSGGGRTMVADPPQILTVPFIEVTEPFIHILPTSDESRVVTAIEVLSPTNKAPGSEGHKLYHQKQEELLYSNIHLLEIDLLREGAHTVAAPGDRLRAYGDWDYLVCLHRSGEMGRFEFWPNSVRQPLPRIPIPLTNGDPDVVVDLQRVFDLCYNRGAYRYRLNYETDPPMPLRQTEDAWADTLLKEKGLRK